MRVLTSTFRHVIDLLWLLFEVVRRLFEVVFQSLQTQYIQHKINAYKNYESKPAEDKHYQRSVARRI
jgi:hypothetical protein